MASGLADHQREEPEGFRAVVETVRRSEAPMQEQHIVRGRFERSFATSVPDTPGGRTACRGTTSQTTLLGGLLGRPCWRGSGAGVEGRQGRTERGEVVDVAE